MDKQIYVVMHSIEVVGEEPQTSIFGAYSNKDEAYKQAEALDKLADKDVNEEYWVGQTTLKQ